MTRVTEVYDAAEAYEIAFSYRDVPVEVDALERWLGRRPASALELAAGPATHAVEFAKRGVRCTVLDLSAAMCERAAHNALIAGVKVDIRQENMISFDVGDRFDLAYCMVDSIAHILTLDDLISHLCSVRKHLTDDGCYVIEGSHPAELIGADKRVLTEWEQELDGRRAVFRWGTDDDRIDPITQVLDCRVTLILDGELAGSSIIPNRCWTADETDAAGRLADLRVGARYGDFDDIPVTDDRAWRMITVLRPAVPGRIMP